MDDDQVAALVDTMKAQAQAIDDLTKAVADVRNQLKRQVWLKERELAYTNPTMASVIGLDKIDFGRRGL